MNTSDKGYYAVLKVEQRAAEKSIIVSKPTVETHYDLLLDDGKTIKKAQVKYADGNSPNSDGVIVAWLQKRNGGSKKCHCYETKDCDVVLVYAPKIERVLCFGPDVFTKKSVLYIRYEEPKNGRKTGLIKANDFVW